MWNLKHNTNEYICKTETRLPDIENKQVIARGQGVGGRKEIGEEAKEVQNSSCNRNES